MACTTPKVHILLYTAMLLAVSFMPFAIHMSGPLYLAAAVLLGARFLYWTIVLYRDSRPHAAIKTFKFSIWYLFALFIALLVDHYLLLSISSGLCGERVEASSDEHGSETRRCDES